MRLSHWSSIASRRWAVSIGQCVLCALIAGAGAGCVKARAQTVPNGPPLEIPDPPSRVFAPLEEEPLVSSPTDVSATAAAPKAVPTPAPPARRAPTPEPEKPATPAPAASVDAPRQLQAVSAPPDPESERRITDVISAASRDLNRVDYRGLTRGGRESYDQAKGFIDEAQKALSARNFIYAQTAADKAAKLANELLGR